MTKVRGFEIAKGWENRGIELPRRSTAQAAAYDIAAAEDIIVPPFHPGIAPTMIPTGLKAYCQPDECYLVLNRSSGAGKGIVMANGIGLIDADYYNNPTNDGHVHILVFNISGHELKIKKGERIAQVIFQKFLTVDNDQASGVRRGGIGSTDQKPLKAVYDVDDVLWPCGEVVFNKVGADYNLQEDFRITNDPHFTDEEKQKITDGFHDAKNFVNMPFYPAARDIFKVEALGAAVEINSNCYSEAILKAKHEQLTQLFDSNLESKLKLNLVTPHSNHKYIPKDVLIFVDDSPYNVASSAAKYNLVPRRPWNNNPKMKKVAQKGGKIILDDLETLPETIADNQQYIIFADDLETINQLVHQIVKLTKEQTS